MAAQIVWCIYLVLAFIAAPAVFRTRWGRWPFAYTIPPRDAYAAVDFMYGLSLAAYTGALFFGAAPDPVSTWWGLACFGAGFGLQVWAIIVMGHHWRIGRDAADDTVRYVSCGPFRLLRHPIYISLIVIAIGQALLAGFDGRSFLLVTATVIYCGVQGRAETLFWRNRGRGRRSS